MIRTLSFFAGIGGIELGLEWAGCSGPPSGWLGAIEAKPKESVFEMVGQIELEPYALSVLNTRWPDVPRLGDITKLAGSLPKADLWCGGFPCQDISTAGKGAGITGTRSGLFFDWMRLAEKERPPMILMENVGALLFRGIDAVMAELVRIGYNAEWECVPAAAMGAKHHCDRVFILALSPEAPIKAGCWAGPARASIRDTLAKRNVGGLWSTDPGMERLVPKTKTVENRLERLGNAVVPQVAELLGTMLLNPLSDPVIGVKFAKLDSDGNWVRTRESMIFDSELFDDSWPRSGTLVDGVVSARRPCLCPLGISLTDYCTHSGWDSINPGDSYTLSRSLWPIPRGADSGQQQWADSDAMQDSNFSRMLISEVVAEEEQGYPTPRGMDGLMGIEWKTTEQAQISMERRGRGPNLSSSVALQKPTEDGLLPKDKRLNPEWVEWLMGFPRGWTEVESVEDIIDSSLIKSNKKEKA